MSIWRWCKLVQVSGTSPGTPNQNDHFGDFIDTDDATLRYFNSPLPLTVTIKYAYEIWFYLEAIRTPRTSLSSFRFYSINSQPDVPNNKLTLFAGTTATYTTPVKIASSVATTAVHTNYYGPSNYLSIPGTLTAIGDKSNYLVLQLKYVIGHGKIERTFIPMHFYFTVT